VRPQGELIRYARDGSAVRIDPDRRLPGRGAYTCPDAGCLRIAIKRKGIQRTLRSNDLTVEGKELEKALLKYNASKSSGEVV